MVNEPFFLFRAGVGLGDPHFDQLTESIGMQFDRRDPQDGAEAAIVLNEVEPIMADLKLCDTDHVVSNFSDMYCAPAEEPMHLKVDHVGLKNVVFQILVLFSERLPAHGVREAFGQILKNLPLKCSIKFHGALSRGRGVVWKRKATAFEGVTQIGCGASA